MEKTFFQTVVERIKGFGYRVFVRDDDTKAYGFFSDGKHIGYFQVEYGSRIHLSTHNAPGSSCSGYSVLPGADSTVAYDGLDTDILTEAFRRYPEWTRRLRWRKKVVKYDDLDDFLARYWNRDHLVEV